MKPFDFLLAGGGGAGLTLASHLLAAFPEARLLLAERDEKNRNDRTWSYWADRPFLFDDLASQTWDRVRFVGNGWDSVIPLGNYRYRLIRGLDLYRATDAQLAAHPGVVRVRGEVTALRDTESGVEMVVNGQTYAGRWAFDSRFDPHTFVPPTPPYHYLMQHFVGWEIETADDRFDPDTPSLFDFRTPQRGAMRFMYVLPSSPRRALVEYTLFSPRLLPQAEYEAALRDYIRDVIGTEDYTIAEREQGLIPMTEMPFERRGGQHILRIGTRAGMAKASTGYTFTRMQRDHERIIAALQRHGHPFHGYQAPARYRSFDAMLLEILEHRGPLIERIFADLFRNNPIGRLFRFLDEESRPDEDLRVMASVPPLPFIRSFFDVARHRVL